VAFAIGLNAEHFAKAGDAFNVAEVFEKVLRVGVESSGRLRCLGFVLCASERERERE
jgi:hypothetical protein